VSVIITNTGIRVTLFFEDGITGWTESHYDSQITTLQGAVTKALAQLVPARVQCLAAGPWLKYIRASRDGTFRDSQIAYTLPPGSSQSSPVYINNQRWAGTAAAVDWTTALLRGVGGDFYRKNIYLSGIPYSDPLDIGEPQLDQVLVRAVQQYANILSGQGYGFPVWLRDPGQAAQALIPVSSIVWDNANLRFVFTTAAAHNLPQNPLSGGTFWRAFLHGLQFTPSPGWLNRLKPSPNGGYNYVYLSPTTFALPRWFAQGPTGPVIGNYTYVANSGTFQAQQRGVATYQPTRGIVLERFTHRKRGRPFDSPVGKSRNRLIYAV